MDESSSIGGGMGGREMRRGDDFVCPNCGSEVMVKHPGDPQKMPLSGYFTCACGTRMEYEHPEGTEAG